MNKFVFIVTHRSGFESDPVIDVLREHGVNVFRFNTDAGQESSRSSFYSQDSSVEFACDGRHITGSDIAIGWCQQLPPYVGKAGSKRDMLQRKNLLTLQMAAFDQLDIPWFNNPRRVKESSNKVNQLAAARSIGLKMPKTLVSDQPETIRSFAADQTIVAKSLATPWFDTRQGTKAAYTKIVDDSWLANDAALSFAPVIYQKFHERAKDFRVVMVGDESFAASCVPNQRQREDVRRESATGKNFDACEFDDHMTEKLRELMSELGIDYCSADFMEDKQGNLYFLDLNTCGAWWWIDRYYNGAICQSIANKLTEQAGGLS